MIDVAAAAAEFKAQDELVFRDRVLPAERLAEILREVERVEPAATRVHVPFVRRGGTVGGRTLRSAAPSMASLYEELLPVVSALVGRPLHPKGEDDDHSVVLYSYRGGDFMRHHHDKCGSPKMGSYSFLVGIVNETTSRLECQISGGRRLRIATSPGSLTIYNGSRVYHGVSRLGPGERRIVLSGSYRTETKRSSWHQLVQDVQEGLLYFGWRLKGRPPPQ